MRFIVTDPAPPTLDGIEAGLKEVDPAYSLDGEDLYLGEELYGEIEVNLRGEELCDEELGELEAFLEDVEESEEEPKQQVVATLHAAKAIVAVRVLWQSREPEQTMVGLDPVFDWLFGHYSGLMQVDGNGYYDEDEELILEVD